MRSNIFFYRDNIRYSVNELRDLGVTTELQATNAGYYTVSTNQISYDRYTEKLIDNGVVFSSNSFVGWHIDWKRAPLNPVEVVKQTQALKTVMIADLKGESTKQLMSGVISDALGTDHRYDTDKAMDIVNLMISLQLNAPDLVTCTNMVTKIKRERPHTAEQIVTVFNELLRKRKCKNEYWIKVDLINACEDVKALRNLK